MGVDHPLIGDTTLRLTYATGARGRGGRCRGRGIPVEAGMSQGCGQVEAGMSQGCGQVEAGMSHTLWAG